MASHCDISLKIVDKSIQYLEKIVPAFELEQIPDINELSKPVKVIAPKSSQCTIKKKQFYSLMDYAHRNRKCKFKVNPKSLHYHSKVSDKKFELDETLDLEEDSLFDKILPDGRLDIKDEDDNSDSEEKNLLIKSEPNIFELNKDFFIKKNIELYNYELESLLNKEDEELEDKDFYNKNNKKISDKKAKNQTEDDKEYLEVSESDEDITFISEIKKNNSDDRRQSQIKNEDEILFRPYKDYWMYHINVNALKEKHFGLFEKELPKNFLWLLNVCSDTLEMSNEDLYEEICLIESYHLNLLQDNSDVSKNKDYNLLKCHEKLLRTNLKKKW